MGESVNSEEGNLVPAKKADRCLRQSCGYLLICQKRKQTSTEGQERCKQE